MSYRNRHARVNVKFLIVVILVTAAIGTSLVAARQIRRSILSKVSLTAGETAFQNKNWPAAYTNYKEYLSRNPDDLDILRKCAKARLAMRPLDPEAVRWAIGAYRLILQRDPLDDLVYEQLAKLYAGMGDFGELMYIAQTRLAHAPEDPHAPLWLADALIQQNKLAEARKALEKLLAALEARPDKHVEYVQACVRMSDLVVREGSPDAKAKALAWLNKAVEYDPASVEAQVSRARFYRQTPEVPGLSTTDRSALARKDLESADALGTEDPKVRYALGTEWMAQGQFDRAAAELQAAEKLTPEMIEKQFLDIDDWKMARFLLASELAARRQATAEGVSLADEALTVLKEPRHRVQLLPTAVAAYVVAGKVAEARRCLDEYIGILRARGTTAETKIKIAWLQALVARAEERFYLVIDTLKPVVVNDTSRPELLRLLAEAYSRTDQPRRAVNALIQYLRSNPQDPEMMLQLSREYLKLREWNKAFEVAKLAEPLNPTDTVLQLLRIETSIYATAERQKQVDMAKLEAYSAELAKLRQEHPDRVDIRLLQAAVATYLDQPDKAESELKLAIQECKEPLRAEIELVRHYFRLKRMTDAISTCEAACKGHPDIAEPWLSLSNLHAAHGDYQSAGNCLRQGLQTATARWEKRSLTIALGVLELTHGDRAAGIRLLSDWAATSEYEIRARTLLLSTREIQQDRPTAEKLIAELRKAESESGLLWRLHQASFWLSCDDWRSKQQEIAGLLQYCIDSDPEWSSPALVLAELYDKLGDAKRVEDVCRQALLRNPSATDIADKLLILLENQGRFSDAEKVLSGVETDSRVTGAWQVRMALRSGDFSRAIDELKLRASNDSGDANSRIQLARLVYWQTKDAEQALGYLKEAQAIAPDLPMLTAVKASILRSEGRTAEAQQLLDEYVAKHNDFGAYLLRASYLMREGRSDQAEQDYKKLATFGDKGAAGYLLLSSFYSGSQRRDQAIATLDEGLKAYPADGRLRRQLMQLLFLRARPEDRKTSLEMLTALEQEQPQDPELMKLRAASLLAEPSPQSMQAAREKLETAVKLEPTAVDAHLLLIGIAMEAGQYEVARDCAVRALGSNPNNPSLLTARGRAELALRNPRMAVELARLVLQADPNNAAAMDVLVDAGLNSSDRSLLEEARTQIESAVGRSPKDEKLLLLRARALVAMEQPKQAIPELAAYCQTQEGSGHVVALVTLADLYRLTGDMDQAGRQIEKAERLDPNSLTVVHTRFMWLAVQKRFDELARLSPAYLRAKGQDAGTVLKAASVLSTLDSADLRKEGVKLFEHAVALSPISIEARLGLASSLYQTGQAERAEKTYRELLAQYPNDIRVLNDLAWILQEHSRSYSDALALVDKGLGLAPADVHLLDTRGTILSNMDDRLADAKSDFEKLVSLSASDTRQQARALLQLGRVCARLNDFAHARQHLETALQIDQKAGVFTADERSEIARIVQKNGT